MHISQEGNFYVNMTFFQSNWRIFEVRRFGSLTEQFGRTGSAVIDRRFGRTVRVRSYTNHFWPPLPNAINVSSIFLLSYVISVCSVAEIWQYFAILQHFHETFWKIHTFASISLVNLFKNNDFTNFFSNFIHFLHVNLSKNAKIKELFASFTHYVVFGKFLLSQHFTKKFVNTTFSQISNWFDENIAI